MEIFTRRVPLTWQWRVQGARLWPWLGPGIDRWTMLSRYGASAADERAREALRHSGTLARRHRWHVGTTLTRAPVLALCVGQKVTGKRGCAWADELLVEPSSAPQRSPSLSRPAGAGLWPPAV